MSLDAFLEQLIEEREAINRAINRANARHRQLSDEELKQKIEHGFMQSERGEVVDGETFTAELLREIDDEIERKQQAG